MKKLILSTLFILIASNCIAGKGYSGKPVEIKPRKEWSSYKRLQGKYNNALLEIEDNKFMIADLKNENEALLDYINTLKPEIVEIEKEVKIKEEIEVIPWWMWGITLIALII